MILYQVYINDPECPSLQFNTYNYGKAHLFVHNYNAVNKPEKEYKAFVYELNLDETDIENYANTVLKNYTVHWECSLLMKDGQINEITSCRVFNDNNDEYATPYYGEDNLMEVNLIFNEDPAFIDFNDPLILQHINDLIKQSVWED